MRGTKQEMRATAIVQSCSSSAGSGAGRHFWFPALALKF